MMKLMTKEQRLATMIATGRKTIHAYWFFSETHGEPKGIVSALTGTISAREDMWTALDHHIANLPRKQSVDDCMAEAKQRIADFITTAGDEEECLELIKARGGRGD